MSKRTKKNGWTKPASKQRPIKAGQESWRLDNVPTRTLQLLEMLTYKRPHNSRTTDEWVEKYIFPTGAQVCSDSGNYILDIGEKPVTMFCSHVDTVHRDEGLQRVLYDANIGIISKDDGVCLGADDGTGVWVLLGLIEAKIPGRYIFHVGEERGGIGSGMLADTQDLHGWFDGIKHAVAFDRRGVDDVITHQMCGRCCSDVFAKDLSKQLGMMYKPSSGGVFTDTAQYTGIISECTNISVGYEHEHSKSETQDVWHLERLMAACLTVDWANLPEERDPSIEDYSYERAYGFGSGYGNSYGFHSSYIAGSPAVSHEDIASLVYMSPEAAIQLLDDLAPTEIDVSTALSKLKANGTG